MINITFDVNLFNLSAILSSLLNVMEKEIPKSIHSIFNYYNLIITLMACVYYIIVYKKLNVRGCNFS